MGRGHKQVSDQEIEVIQQRIIKGEKLARIATEYPISRQALQNRITRFLKNQETKQNLSVAGPMGSKIAIHPLKETIHQLKVDPEPKISEGPNGEKVPVYMRGDRIRGLHEIIVGHSHRGTIQACLDDMIQYLKDVQPLPRRGRGS
jgi:hypothetical protein